MKDWCRRHDESDVSIGLEFAAIAGIYVLTFMGGISACASIAHAHGGGLAADGCHFDRSTGERHCHRGPKAGPTTAPKKNGGREVYYPNCAAARQAGVTPIYRNQPGYGRHLDRDGDGKAVE